MADDAQLRARIAALSSQINQHKQQKTHPTYQSHVPHNGNGYPGNRARWQPYNMQRGGHHTPFKNRTLQVNGGGNQGAIQNGQDNEYVRTGNKLMTKAAFDREQESRKEHRSGTGTPVKSRETPGTPSAVARELVIEGIRFTVQDGGRKLIRIPGQPSCYGQVKFEELKQQGAGEDIKQTPKKVQVSGIDFYRTKKGNLARANIATNSRLQQTPSQQCETFTKHGTCPYGPSCKFAHDPKKIAICKDFLHTGVCRAGSYCDLSHEPTYHRAPACTHFLRGNCTNDACRYPHINISASAPVCRAFATLGYCSKGTACCKRHVTECPDYANKGHCQALPNGKCSLPHIDRASTLRKAAKRSEKTGSEEESDLSSEADEEEDGNNGDVEMVEVDSDEIEDDLFVPGSDDNGALTQQKDFVPF